MLELLAVMQQRNKVQNLEDHSIAALHTETYSDVSSATACHSLNLINGVILMESADSLPLVHFDDQSLMRECDSAAANQCCFSETETESSTS